MNSNYLNILFTLNVSLILKKEEYVLHLSFKLRTKRYVAPQVLLKLKTCNVSILSIKNKID